MTLQDYVNELKSKTITVIGAGVSNMPLIELLLHNNCSVSVRDKQTAEEMGEKANKLYEAGAVLITGPDYLENITEDIVFRTPGLMPFDPHLASARQHGSVITSEMEVFFSLCPCRIIAVTGSDGKTTTTTIISEILKAAGYTVHLGGNIGHPLLCDLPEFTTDDIAVLELSSFQLHSMSCRPDVAVITNISPNHLDKHIDYKDYYDAKKNIFIKQSIADKLVLNALDEHTDYYRQQAKSRVWEFSDFSPVKLGSYCENGIIYIADGKTTTEIMPSEQIRLPGRHNLQNYLAAFAATAEYVLPEVQKSVAASFAGVEHRLEFVREVNGVTFINDSIGTSPTRTIAGLHALKTRPVILAGGYDKHIPFNELGDELCKHAKAVFLCGATANLIRESIENSAYYNPSELPVIINDDFDKNVMDAYTFAENGDTILLSPACAAFDLFKNFAERGKHFKNLVMEIQDENI